MALPHSGPETWQWETFRHEHNQYQQPIKLCELIQH